MLKSMMIRVGRSIGGAVGVVALVLLASGSNAATAPAGAVSAAPVQAEAAPRKILFLAGPKEHGSPGRHEYEKDLRELAWSLEHASNLKGFRTEVIVGKPPRDLSVYEDAALIVVDGNGDWLKRETGMLFPQAQDTDGRTYDAETTAWLKSFDDLLKRKHIGVAMFHYTMWNNNWAGQKYLLDWLGGLWIPYSSHNPVDTWAVTPLKVKHPVLSGVKPWTFREEMYSRYFLFTNPNRTELLQGMPKDPKNGGPDPISWVYQRPDGARAFVWGGSDFHDNMHKFADYRRFLLNGIVWAAGGEVPRGGVASPPPPEM
jgi:type 1 glutamine amidotransferase